MSPAPRHVVARDNPLLVRLRKLARAGGAYRKLGAVWLEGDHLCRAAVQRGVRMDEAVLPEPAWADAALRELAAAAPRVTLLPEALFAGISGLESPGRIGFVLPMPAVPAIDATLPSVVLDRVQDAGNVGSILRSAAAFGVGQVVALKGSVALWSPKVLRAGMGAHFALRLVEGLAAEDAAEALAMPLIATSSYAALPIDRACLPHPCAWLFGHEGQGLAPALQRQAALAVRIPQPGGEESLNVAAAAAVCLYEALRQRTAPA